MNAHDFAKYLRRNPAPPAEPPLPHAAPRCTVIPACDELETLPETLASLERAGNRNPVLIVVNHPAEASARVRDSSAALLRKLRNRQLSGAEHLHWIFAPDLKYGVGEARKLGMDCFAASHTAETAATAAIFSLDADSPVRPNYFSCCEACFAARPEAGTLIVPVRHQAGETPELERAVRRYEAYLERYVAKLREAGSPYAFPAIGSGFAVRLETCLRAGGMRRRRGGEDFYFLQAAVKVAPFVVAPEALVMPSGRPSERVPFGTGPAVRHLLAGGTLPEIGDAAFDLLRALLAAMPGGEPPPEGRRFLEKEGFYDTWPRILANTPEGGEKAAFDCWFDGLKTLRFLHFCDAARRSQSTEIRRSASSTL